MSLILTVFLNGLAIARIRAWNPSREVRRGAHATQQITAKDETEVPGGISEAAAIAMHAAPGKVRHVPSRAAPQVY